MCASDGAERNEYDFFYVHLLTTSHAVRIILPLIPAEYHVRLVREWWLLVIAIYIAQLRPKIDKQRITDFDVKGKGLEVG